MTLKNLVILTAGVIGFMAGAASMLIFIAVVARMATP